MQFDIAEMHSRIPCSWLEYDFSQQIAVDTYFRWVPFVDLYLNPFSVPYRWVHQSFNRFGSVWIQLLLSLSYLVSLLVMNKWKQTNYYDESFGTWKCISNPLIFQKTRSSVICFAFSRIFCFQCSDESTSNQIIVRFVFTIAHGKFHSNAFVDARQKLVNLISLLIWRTWINNVDF